MGVVRPTKKPALASSQTTAHGSSACGPDKAKSHLFGHTRGADDLDSAGAGCISASGVRAWLHGLMWALFGLATVDLKLFNNLGKGLPKLANEQTARRFAGERPTQSDSPVRADMRLTWCLNVGENANPEPAGKRLNTHMH